jgi:hypothetical protein
MLLVVMVVLGMVMKCFAILVDLVAVLVALCARLALTRRGAT